MGVAGETLFADKKVMTGKYSTKLAMLSSLVLMFTAGHGILVGCAVMHSFPSRSYREVMSDQGPNEWILPRRDFALMQGDGPEPSMSFEQALDRTPGSLEESPSTDDQFKRREEYLLQQELRFLEARQPQELKDQYDHYQDYFRTTSEKIYFLKLSANLAHREHYLNSLGYQLSEYHSPAAQTEPEQGRYWLTGMSERTVTTLMGTPLEVNQTERGKQLIYPGSHPFYHRAVYLERSSEAHEWTVKGWQEFRKGK